MSFWPLSSAVTTIPHDGHTLFRLLRGCEERRDLTLLETMQRLLSLALDKARAAGFIAENFVI